MKFLKLSNLTFYKNRYFIGYGTILAILIYSLATISLTSPGGISYAERQSVVDSSSLQATNLAGINVVDLPYRFMQHVSMLTLGVSNFSLKLPSIIIAFVTAIGIILLLTRWFHRHIAVIASLVALTTSEFLFLTQDGTPAILYLFWTVWLLLFGTYIAKKVKFLFTAKVMFFIGLALSLYTPLSIYTIFALAITAFLHPHLRYLFKQLPKGKITGAFIVGIVALVPLVLSIIAKPSIVLTLLGIPQNMPNIWENIQQLAHTFFGFASPTVSEIMTPFFGLGSILLIIMGISRLVRTSATTQSYLILVWSIILVPVVILNPDKALVLLLPLTLLLSTGIDTLLDYWYSLFPKNPYARIAGLVPILVLIGTLVWSGFERYTYGYHYSPDIYSVYTDDLKLFKDRNVQIVVSPGEQEFYKALRAYNHDLDVQTAPYASEVVATNDSDKTKFDGYTIEKIITSSSTSDSDRFYIYKKTQ